MDLNPSPKEQGGFEDVGKRGPQGINKICTCRKLQHCFSVIFSNYSKSGVLAGLRAVLFWVETLYKKYGLRIEKPFFVMINL